MLENIINNFALAAHSKSKNCVLFYLMWLHLIKTGKILLQNLMMHMYVARKANIRVQQNSNYNVAHLLTLVIIILKIFTLLIIILL